MSATNGFETSLLTLIFNNTAIANIGNAGGLQPSSAPGDLYVGLTTADPTETGSTANELAYTGYARIAVARSAGGWTISSNNASNAAAITFGEMAAGGPESATHFFIATALTGGDVLFSGALTGTLVINDGVIPEFAIGDLDINAD